MKNSIKFKLLFLLSLAMIFLTVSTVIGISLLVSSQTKDQNKIRLTSALDSFEKRFEDMVLDIETDLENYTNNLGNSSTWIKSISIAVTPAMHNPVVKELYTLGANADLESLAFYYAPYFKNEHLLHYVYSKKYGSLLEYTNKNVTEFVPNKYGTFDVKKIIDPSLFPHTFKSGKSNTLKATKNGLLFIAQREYLSMVNLRKISKDDLLGYFILEKKLNFDWRSIDKELGVNFNIYDVEGIMGGGDITMPDIDLVKADFSKDEIFILESSFNEKFDSLLSPIVYHGETIGYISVSISQELTTKKVQETILVIGLISFVILLIVLFFAGFVIKNVIEPINKLTNTTLSIAAGKLDEKVDVKSDDELGVLANSVNKMRDSLNERNKELQKYLDIVNKYILISTTDLNGIITYANEALSKTSGYTVAELEGQRHSIIRHPDMPKSAFKDMWDTIKNGKTWRGKVKNRKKSGGYYWVDTVITPNFSQNGKINSYNAVRIDITDKIKLEELIEYQETVIKGQIKVANSERDKAEKFAKAKSEFLANMSHEIRTPLNAIIGFVDILKEESKGRKSFEYVDIIYKSSQALLSIIEDILDFSKIESAKLNIDKIFFNPYEEFKIITNLFSETCSQNGITLNININQSLPQSINTDPLRVKQVISNLLSNAIKFTKPKKSIFVNIEYVNGLLKVSVKDEGKGIETDKLEYIFEAFNQEDSSTTRNYGGTGLGLTISSKLVELLGGKLKVKSELGKGSEFYFTIPAAIGKTVNEKAENTTNNYTFNKEKVLVVEDNKSNQMLMQILLKKLNLSFEFANDGVEAVEMFKTNKYDIILMDENMPNMNGIEATKLILEYEKQNNLEHTPIIALTANALKGDRERFLEAGMDEYLTKPIDKNKLNEVVGMFFNS